MSYRPVDVSWIAERCPEVKEALSHYLKGEISYEDALKLAIGDLYNTLIDARIQLNIMSFEFGSPSIEEDTLEKLREQGLIP